MILRKQHRNTAPQAEAGPTAHAGSHPTNHQPSLTGSTKATESLPQIKEIQFKNSPPTHKKIKSRIVKASSTQQSRERSPPKKSLWDGKVKFDKPGMEISFAASLIPIYGNPNVFSYSKNVC